MEIGYEPPPLAVKANQPSGSAAKNAANNAAPEEGFSFWDVLDLINPLQHIPIVGSVYRAITGDEIKPAMQIMGGGLFGGPIGLAAGMAQAVVREANGGKDIGETMLAGLFGNDEATTPDNPQNNPPSKQATNQPGNQPAIAAASQNPTIQPAAYQPDADASPAVQLAGDALPQPRPSQASAFFQQMQHPGLMPRFPAANQPAADHRPVIEIRPRRSDSPSAAPAKSTIPQPDPAQSASKPAQQPPALPPQLIADMMMLNLDKYQAMSHQEKPANPPDTP